MISDTVVPEGTPVPETDIPTEMVPLTLVRDDRVVNPVVADVETVAPLTFPPTVTVYAVELSKATNGLLLKKST